MGQLVQESLSTDLSHDIEITFMPLSVVHSELIHTYKLPTSCIASPVTVDRSQTHNLHVSPYKADLVHLRLLLAVTTNFKVLAPLQ